MYTLSGEIGSLFTHHLRNAVDRLNLEGAKLSLWVGRGFFSKPFVVKGEARWAIKSLERWMKEMQD